MKRFFSVLLTIISVVLLVVAVPAGWARNTLLNTDNYVSMVTPIAQDPRVHKILAKEITNAAFDALVPKDRRDQWFDNLPALRPGGPLAALTAGMDRETFRKTAEGFLRQAINRRALQVVSSDLFVEFWAKSNELVHSQVLAALKGDINKDRLVDGKVAITVVPMVAAALRGVVATISELTGRQITLPQIPVDTKPKKAIAKLEKGLGIDLPSDFGTIQLIDPTDLKDAQKAVDLFETGTWAVLALLVLTGAGAIWLGGKRKKGTAVGLFGAYATVLLVQRQAVKTGAEEALKSVKPKNMAGAAHAVADAVMAPFMRFTGTLLIICIVVIVVLVGLMINDRRKGKSTAGGPSEPSEPVQTTATTEPGEDGTSSEPVV